MAITFDKMINDVRFVLDQHAKLDFYRAMSLIEQSSGRHVES
jgi:hypothetical protein